MTLTGMETWAIIAPILAAEMVTKHDIATDAYITTFHALKMYDKPKPEITVNDALRIISDYLNRNGGKALAVTYKENEVQLSIGSKRTLMAEQNKEAEQNG